MTAVPSQRSVLVKDRSSKRSAAAIEGLTLLEILVALAILSVAFMISIQLLDAGLEYKNRARNLNVAASVAQEKMETLMKGAQSLPEKGTTGKEFPFAEFKWSVDVSGGPGNLKVATVEVTWAERMRERNFRLVSYLSD